MTARTTPLSTLPIDTACTVTLQGGLTPTRYDMQTAYLRKLAAQHGLIITQSSPIIFHLYGPRGAVEAAAARWNDKRGLIRQKSSHEVVDTDE